VAVGLFVVPKHVFGHVVVEFIYKPIAPNSLKLHLLDRKQLVIIVSVFVFHAVFLVRNVGEQLSCSLSRTIFKLFHQGFPTAPPLLAQCLNTSCCGASNGLPRGQVYFVRWEFDYPSIHKLVSP